MASSKVMAAMAALLATAGAWGQQGPRIGSRRISIVPMRGASSAASSGSSNPNNIPYNGGLLLPATTTYAFWWGRPSDFPSDARQGVHEFLEGLEGSGYLQIADQYMFGQKTHTRFGGDLFDYSEPPLQPVDLTTGYSSLAPEVCNVLSANGQKPDPDGIYIIYPSNFPAQNSYCAFHGLDTCADGTLMHIAYVPNFTDILPACGTSLDPLFSPNKQSEATRGMVNSTAHEFMESITDPNLDAWFDSAGNEVADFCNFIFQSWVPLAVGTWKIQEIWSNAAGGCVQGNGRQAQVVGAVSSAGAVTTFNIPAANYGFFSQSINIDGSVAGYYTDATHEFHAFLRDNRGNISTIDPTNTGPGYYGGAQAFGINAEGTIAGNYGDTNFVLHGFVRDNQGNFVTIDAPGAAGTFANAINNKGVVAGDYFDANSVNHGFVRDALGNITTFDAPGASPGNNGLFGGTTVLGINANGAVTGNYQDANSLSHGFVRYANGTIASFDVPLASQGTFPQSINDLGQIAGYYTDANFVSHGFVRDPLSHITTFDDANAISGTFVFSINAFGAVAGYYSDKNGFPQSFVRGPLGNFVTIPGKGANYGSVVRSINAVGATAGYETAATN